MPHVKICCIGSIAEAQLAIAEGAAAVGLVSQMPSGPGVIGDEQIAAITRAVAGIVDTFLLTSRTESGPLIAQVRESGANTIQLVDAVADRVYHDLKRNLPKIRIVQVIHVTDGSAVDEARRIAEQVDALLLDSGNPALAVKELGGTGRTHDWDYSRRIVDSVKCPVFLAGGLNPGNIQEAVRKVRPHGVDLCSGVRTGGDLDPVKLASFFAAVRSMASEPLPPAGDSRFQPGKPGIEQDGQRR